jgi:hypothetical protein
MEAHCITKMRDLERSAETRDKAPTKVKSKAFKVSASEKEEFIAAVIARNERENPPRTYKDNYERGLYASTSTSEGTDQYGSRYRGAISRPPPTPTNNTRETKSRSSSIESLNSRSRVEGYSYLNDVRTSIRETEQVIANTSTSTLPKAPVPIKTQSLEITDTPAQPTSVTQTDEHNELLLPQAANTLTSHPTIGYWNHSTWYGTIQCASLYRNT